MIYVIWLPAMFVLELAAMGICLAFGPPAKSFEEGITMTVVTILVTAAVLVYLFTALVRPEWF